MKNKFIKTWQTKNLFLCALLILTFSSCKKTPVVATASTVSGLMAFNLIPDSTFSIAFAFSNISLTNTPISYPSYTGNYVSINSGNQQIGLFKANPDSLLVNTTFTFEPAKYYSAFAMGANGNYKDVIIADKVDSLPTGTGNAFVRFVNAIPDSSKPTVTIALNGTNVVNEAAPFGTVSDFVGVTPGSISVNMDNGSTISANKTISVGANNVYTILLVGIPGVSDTTRAIRISYILNGTVAP